MAVLRLQCSFMADSALPEDRIVIDPHFLTSWEPISVPGDDPDVDQLCEDMAVGLEAVTGFTGEINVAGYAADQPAPQPPRGRHIINAGIVGGTTGPREIALCLSYYSAPNAPRRRGRLYWPYFAVGGSLALRPTTTQMNRVLRYSDLLKNLGGTNVDWCVWSRTDNAARSISHIFVDDEWDIIRSRGLKSSSRVAETINE